jgi:intracellular septation protein A
MSALGIVEQQPLVVEDPALVRPPLKAVVARVALSLWVACVVPALLFTVALLAAGVTTALIVALVWSYGAIGWRWATGRRRSGLLALMVFVMTIRSAVALATGDTFLYFFQPVIIDCVIAVGFLLSLVTARPVVARLAADFYPMDRDIACRPRIQRLLWNLTLMWGLVCIVKGGISLWLLESQSVVTFVLVKNIVIISMTVACVIVTVTTSAHVARKEGLLAAR